MRELSKTNGVRVITPITRNGQLKKISEELTTSSGDPMRRIEVDVYENGTEGFIPYLLEFYVYEPSDILLLDTLLEEDDWVSVKYKTQSKENKRIGQTYTTSTLVSINKINKEEVVELNNAIKL